MFESGWWSIALQVLAGAVGCWLGVWMSDRVSWPWQRKRAVPVDPLDRRIPGFVVVKPEAIYQGIRNLGWEEPAEVKCMPELLVWIGPLTTLEAMTLVRRWMLPDLSPDVRREYTRIMTLVSVLYGVPIPERMVLVDLRTIDLYNHLVKNLLCLVVVGFRDQLFKEYATELAQVDRNEIRQYVRSAEGVFAKINEWAINRCYPSLDCALALTIKRAKPNSDPATHREHVAAMVSVYSALTGVPIPSHYARTTVLALAFYLELTQQEFPQPVVKRANHLKVVK